jgi:hypothetical protein
MNNSAFLRVGMLLAGAVWACVPALSMPGMGAEDESDPAALEAFLGSARIVSIDKSGAGGRTAPWIITLSDGVVERRAIFKYVDRKRPAILPDSYHYELAAYGLSKLVGLRIIPPIVERTIEDVPGSLQLFLENCVKFRDLKRRGIAPPDPAAFRDALAEIGIFENLAFNECGNLEDTLVHKDNWKICRVDFSEAFSPEPALIPGCEVTRCSRVLFETLRHLDLKKLQATLGAFLDEAELRALAKRTGRILDALEGLIKDKGEAAVLFGPPALKDK